MAELQHKENIMSDLNGMIKRVRKIMRKDNGVDGDAQRINQLVWMLFLKVYDELKESNEYELEIDGYKSIIPEECRWRNWAVEKKDEQGRALPDTLTGNDLVEFVNNKLFKTLQNLPVDESTPARSAIVKWVFSRLHNYMINGTLIRQVINELNDSIDFDTYEDRHLFNDIYETILQELQSAGSSGEFYTPRPVTDFMAEKLNPQVGEKVADFACGTGGFLVSAIKHILKNNNTQEALDSLQSNIIGGESKPLPYLLCVTNMLLNGTDGSNIIYGSSLSKNVYEYTVDDQVDVVLMNPPFGGEIAPGEDKNFPESFRTSETANLFVALVLYRLKAKGRVGIILPDGFLFDKSDAYVNLKKKLMSDCNLHTIVRLPQGIFYANITTNILFFDKGTKTNGIWFYQVPLPDGYRSFSKTKPFGEEHLQGVRAWWNERNNGDPNAWFVPQEKIIEKGYDINFSNPNIAQEEVSLSLRELLVQIQEKSQAISNSVAALADLIKDIKE